MLYIAFSLNDCKPPRVTSGKRATYKFKNEEINVTLPLPGPLLASAALALSAHLGRVPAGQAQPWTLEGRVCQQLHPRPGRCLPSAPPGCTRSGFYGPAPPGGLRGDPKGAELHREPCKATLHSASRGLESSPEDRRIKAATQRPKEKGRLGGS